MRELHDPKRTTRSRQFDDELIGLDPNDPEAQAFAVAGPGSKPA